METVNRTSLKAVRQEAAKTIMGLQNGTVSPLVADAIYKQSITIVDSYRVELRAIELAINSSPAGLTFETASHMIDFIEMHNHTSVADIVEEESVDANMYTIPQDQTAE